jgi:hypothetical protein
VSEHEGMWVAMLVMSAVVAMPEKLGHGNILSLAWYGLIESRSGTLKIKQKLCCR